MKTFMGYKVVLLFDPIQTHAIHGVHKSEVDNLKAALKEAGATRFRKVQNRYLKDIVSLCFKLK